MSGDVLGDFVVVVAARLAELVDQGAYDGGKLQVVRTPIWATFTFRPGQEPVYRRAEPRRVRNSVHIPGAIGWSWSKVPSDGRGEFYIIVEGDPPAGAPPLAAQARGLDAQYQTIGNVDAAGLAALRSLPVISTMRIKGHAPVLPVMVDRIAVVGLDVAPPRAAVG
jgi:hypothetical protein